MSGGPGDVLVPPVANLRQGQAIDELEDAGLEVTIDREFSDKVKEDFAIRTVPPEGREVTKGTRVRLLVSRGPEQVTVPDVTGLSRESAEARLRDEGLSPSVDEEESDEPEGDVISQSPSRRDRGDARRDRDDHRLHRAAAGRGARRRRPRRGAGDLPARASAGLEPVREERTVTDPSQDGVVIEQRPGAGAQVDEGREVVIVIGVLEPGDTLEERRPPDTP